MEPNTLYRVKIFNEKNRAMQATKDIKSGTLILQCEPIAMAALSSMRNRFCNYCLKEKSQLLKCGVCATLFYCSTDCQKKDWPIHKQECKRYGVITKQKGFKITSDFILLVRAFLLHRSDKGVAEKLNDMLDINDFQSEQKREHFQAMALTFVENFQLQKSAENISVLVSLANKISVNAFTIQDYLFNHDGVAIGLYHPANFFNHSCSPNAVQIFDGRTLRIIAIEDIENDDEICISYIDQLLDQPERNKILRESYLFDCACYHCMAEKAIKAADYNLICAECGKGGLKGVGNGALKCGECNKEYTAAEAEGIRNKIKELKEILLKEKVDYEFGIKSFFNLKKMLRFANPYFSKILQNIYLAALNKANAEQDTEKSMKYYQDAYKILKSYVDNFKIWYKMSPDQEFHPLLLWKYSELGKLAMSLKKIKKAMIYTQKAIQILKKTKFSQALPEVRELKQRYDQLLVECRMYVTTAVN